MDQHILIVGAGSAGRRHAVNLASLGCRISALDPRADRRAELADQVEAVESFETLPEALAHSDGLAGAVVASPPSFHVEQAASLIGARIPVLLEKPVGLDGRSAEALAARVGQAGVPLLLGYTWRWWPPLARVRELLSDGRTGRLVHVRCTLSAHLADWHPWERYQDFFMSQGELGGGALLDESHWIDLMLWLFGMPERVFARIDRLTALEITADDNVDMVLEFADGPRAVLHLDLYGRPHERSITFAGEEGTLRWTENEVRFSRDSSGGWEVERFPHERNDMFKAVASEFLEVVAGAPVRTCAIEDGVRVMHVIDAARRSHAGGTMVPLDPDYT